MTRVLGIGLVAVLMFIALHMVGGAAQHAIERGSPGWQRAAILAWTAALGFLCMLSAAWLVG